MLSTLDSTTRSRSAFVHRGEFCVAIIADDRRVRAKGEFHSRSISTVAFKNVKFHI